MKPGSNTKLAHYEQPQWDNPKFGKSAYNWAYASTAVQAEAVAEEQMNPIKVLKVPMSGPDMFMYRTRTFMTLSIGVATRPKFQMTANGPAYLDRSTSKIDVLLHRGLITDEHRLSEKVSAAVDYLDYCKEESVSLGEPSPVNPHDGVMIGMMLGFADNRVSYVRHSYQYRYDQMEGDYKRRIDDLKQELRELQEFKSKYETSSVVPACEGRVFREE